MIDWIRISISQIACSVGHSGGLTDCFQNWNCHAHCVNTEDTRSIKSRIPVIKWNSSNHVVHSSDQCVLSLNSALKDDPWKWNHVLCAKNSTVYGYNSPCNQWFFNSVANVGVYGRKWMYKWSELLVEEMHLAIWKIMLCGMLRYIDWEVVNGISNNVAPCLQQNDNQSDEGPRMTVDYEFDRLMSCRWERRCCCWTG